MASLESKASTTVLIEDGSALVIAGLLTEEETETVRKVPLLGDIPVLRFFFSNKSTAKVQRELLLFIAPTVVSVEKNEPVPSKAGLSERFVREPEPEIYPRTITDPAKGSSGK